jgi:hypothetical protein
MAELEIHHEGSEHDPVGKQVGVMAALLAVFLAVVTIMSHRAHTEAIIKKTDSNDQWQYYQANKLKQHNLELGARLIGILGPNNPGAKEALVQFDKDKQKYISQANEQKEKATSQSEQSEAAEHRGLRFDLGEGLLEIALVLSSLYFISRKMLFPVVGIIAGIAGLIVAITGLLV